MFGSLISGVFGAIEGSRNREMQRDANAQNAALQKDFARNSIQWKVADAKDAGIHPLAALGAQTMSPSASYQAPVSTELSQMGQNIGRAINATRSKGDRALAELQLASAKADVDGKHIENQIRAHRLQEMQNPSANPIPTGVDEFLLSGQSDSGLVNNTAMPRINSAKGSPNMEPSAVTETGYLDTASGGKFPVRSKDASDRLDDDTLGNLLWNFRNRVLPSFGANYSSPYGEDAALYNPLTQQYERIPERYLKYTPRGVLKRLKRYINR